MLVAFLLVLLVIPLLSVGPAKWTTPESPMAPLLMAAVALLPAPLMTPLL